MSASRLTVVMYALRTRGHSTLPAPASCEEPKQIAELQSSHARQRGKRAPKKGCAVSHAARCGQRKKKEITPLCMARSLFLVQRVQGRPPRPSLVSSLP